MFKKNKKYTNNKPVDISYITHISLKNTKYNINDIDYSQLSDSSKNLAWDIFVELSTRITASNFCENSGVKEAIISLYSLFTIIRQYLHDHGKECHEITPIILCLLNLTLRPFLAKWHKLEVSGEVNKNEFTKEIGCLIKSCFDCTSLLYTISTGKEIYTKNKKFV